MRLLLAEDEKPLARTLAAILEKNNYSVDTVFDGEAALIYLETGIYDGAILDILMPKKDGLSVLRETRASGKSIPILLLTAKAEIDDKVEGLDSGANDYVTKPFDTKELLARLRAMLRTGSVQSGICLSFGNISLNRATFEMSSPSGSIRLPNKEFQMMEILMANCGQLISTERFMEKIWGYNSNSDIHVVWVYISYLRRKLAALHANIEIHATRNAGYCLQTF